MAANPGSKKVMLAMDGSKLSDHAYQWYLKQLREENDYVVLVHCPEITQCQFSNFFTMSSDHLRGMLLEQDKNARLFVARLKEHLKREHMKGKVICKRGNPKDILLNISESEGVDCIITGSHGKKQKCSEKLGSVASYLIHHAKVPVVLVKTLEQ